MSLPRMFRTISRLAGRRPASAALWSLLLAASAGFAQFTTPDCPDYKMADFKYVKLISTATDTTLKEPVRLAFDYRGDGKSDIYFAERHGKIKRWDALKNEMSVLGELDVFSDSPDKPYAEGAETGINGLTLDPDFKTNQRIWVFYSPWKDTVFRLSHFTLKDGKMDMASEKIILDIPESRKHVSAITISGGPLAFDPDGNLWIAIGANSEQYPSVDERIQKRSAEASSANLADLRGSILRIHPDNSAKGYSIPKGNFAEYWTAEYTKAGRPEMAKEYGDPAKVRPEIYVKGTRNPYSLNVDPKTGWVVWGDFGPTQQKTEELNLNNRPAYAGYPYWSGKNIFVLDQIQPWAGAGMDANAPINNSKWNTGPKELPPAEPSVISFSHESAGSSYLRDGFPTSGPIYRYDEKLNSPVKFPPHFDGAWMVTGRIGGLRLFKVNAAGDGYTDSAIFKGAGEPTVEWNRPIELKQGPDGAIYLLEYHAWHGTNPQTHIGRYEYAGTCLPGTPVLARKQPGRAFRLQVTARSLKVEEPGPHKFHLRSLDGREIASLSGVGPKEYPLDLAGRRGVFLLTLEPDRGTWVVPGI